MRDKARSRPRYVRSADQLCLVDISPLPDTDHQLLDATVNQIVELPGSELNEFTQTAQHL